MIYVVQVLADCGKNHGVYNDLAAAVLHAERLRSEYEHNFVVSIEEWRLNEPWEDDARDGKRIYNMPGSSDGRMRKDAAA